MKYIENGWNSYRRLMVPKDATAEKLLEIRQAYYSGAAVLFTALTTGLLDEGLEETDDDLQKMEDLQLEINDFGQHLDKKVFGNVEH